MSELIERLNLQAKEIADAGHNGWGNTMLEASETIGEIAKEAVDYCKMLESTIAEQKRTILDMEAREKRLALALKFYADGSHFTQHQDVLESVSGEPMNFIEDENNTATVEDGTIAKHALSQTESTSEWTARFVADWVRANWKPVMWYEAQESTNGMDVKDIIGSMMYSTAIHTKEPKTSNPVWCLYAIPDKD